MNKDKKPRSGGETPEREEMGAETGQDATSISQSTTPPSERQRAISDFLGHGQSTAVPLRHLKELAHLPGRDVRRMIQAERLRGVPILSDNISGYYLAGNDQERDRFVRSMRGRAAEIEAVADAVERGPVD